MNFLFVFSKLSKYMYLGSIWWTELLNVDHHGLVEMK